MFKTLYGPAELVCALEPLGAERPVDSIGETLPVLDLVLAPVYGSSGRPAHVVDPAQGLLLSDPQDLLDRGSLHELLDVLLELEAFRGGDRVQVVGELEKRVRHARVPHLVQAFLLTHAPGNRAKNSVGHAGEISQGLVPILASTEVDLRHCLQPDHLEDVYYDPGLDSVAGEKRDGTEELPIGDELPCEWLHEACELGVEEVEEWFGRELRNSPSAVLFHSLIALERTSVGGLDEADLGHLQDRAQNAVDELGHEVLGVSVDVHDEIASRDGECAPHGVALAVRAAVVAHELVLRVDLGALRCGHLRGTVR